MSKKWAQVTEEEILNANITKYNDDKIVQFYSDFEEPQYSYYEYEVIFKAVIDVLKSTLGRAVKAVDMCGGAGKAAFTLKKCDPLCSITLVDVSPKMLEIAQRRALQQGIKDIEIVERDAFNFLAEAIEFDLIIFSSAVHHFKDPQKLLCTAASKLSPGGMIVTIADPNILIKSRRYKLIEFMLTNKESKKRTLNRLLKRLGAARTKKPVDGSYACDIAEYQTFTGIDDIKLSYQLARQGLYPLVHLRYPAGEPFLVKLMPLLGLSWAFSLILRPDNHENNIEVASHLRKQIHRDLPFKPKFL